MIKIYEFQWQGYNRFGKKQKGKGLAENREQLEQRLHAQGVERIRIQRNFTLAGKLSSEDLTHTLGQLALLLQAGLPLKQSLSILLENCRQVQMYRWLHHLIITLEQGYSFSESLEKAPSYLLSQEIQLVRMGEKSANLATILASITQNRIKREQLNKKIKKVMFYPLFILLISLTLSLLLLHFIVPQFAELYHSKERELPVITQLLFQLSELLQNYSALLLSSVLLCVTTFIFVMKKSHRFANKLKIAVAQLPIVSTIFNEQRLVFFCQNSALMLTSHLRLDTVLNSFTKTDHDPILSREMRACLDAIHQGYSLSMSLNPKYFPNDVRQMIAVGEKSARLPQILQHIGEMYQQKLDYRTEILAQLLEPVLMLIIGTIVGTILIGLYLPIFDMGAILE